MSYSMYAPNLETKQFNCLFLAVGKHNPANAAYVTSLRVVLVVRKRPVITLARPGEIPGQRLLLLAFFLGILATDGLTDHKAHKSKLFMALLAVMR